MHERERDAAQGDVVGEVDRPVDRVEDPERVDVQVCATLLLAQERDPGCIHGKRLLDHVFDRKIDLGRVVPVPLADQCTHVRLAASKGSAPRSIARSAAMSKAGASDIDVSALSPIARRRSLSGVGEWLDAHVRLEALDLRRGTGAQTMARCVDGAGGRGHAQ